MKKTIILLLSVMIFLSAFVFAGSISEDTTYSDGKIEAVSKTGNTLTLTKYLEMDGVSSGDISIYHGPDVVSVERNRFRKISDEIILEEIKTEDFKTEGGYGFHISAPESMKFAYVSSDGKVSGNNPDGYILKDVDYIISTENLKKIESLFRNEAEKHPLRKGSTGVTAALAGIFVVVILLMKRAKKGG